MFRKFCDSKFFIPVVLVFCMGTLIGTALLSAFFAEKREATYAANAFSSAKPMLCDNVSAIPLPEEAQCYSNKGYLIVKLDTALNFYDGTSRQMVASGTVEDGNYTINFPVFKSVTTDAFRHAFKNE